MARRKPEHLSLIFPLGCLAALCEGCDLQSTGRFIGAVCGHIAETFGRRIALIL